MEELWKNIKGYEGLYEVSNYGRLKSLKRFDSLGREIKSIILKPADRTKYGYLVVSLCKAGKKENYSVHRLVAEAFIPNPDNLPEINHKDGNPKNNCVWNLEWCSHKYNLNYGTRLEKVSWIFSKTTLQLDLQGNLIKEWKSLGEIEDKLGFLHPAISRCCNGKQKTAYGYIWKYKKAV